MKEFKSESKKLLNLMINSIYTNKDIFLREIISNASDALDKVKFQALTNEKIKIKNDELEINIKIDTENRTITIKDNGCGMTKEELEHNLGTIAESGSGLFKQENKDKDVNIIGQFGVGFYSTFMVADSVSVYSKSHNGDKGYLWYSKGEEGYTIDETDKEEYGTEIVLKLKEDTEDFKYSQYLEEYKIRELITKHSNYISYPIKMEITNKKLKEGSKDEYEENKKIEVMNNMLPIWKKNKNDVTEEEYNNFYMTEFYDYEKPLKTINYKVEGLTSYNSILFIPSHGNMDLYSNNYSIGLQLYSKGVLIMEKCKDLIPEYYGFVKGLVNSEDLSLNISREMLQQDKQLKTIAKSIENKITKELQNLLNNDREKYEQFFTNYGTSIKLGIYNTYGAAKEELQDLLLFYSSKKEKEITLKEYIDELKEEEKNIYYISGESIDKINTMPQVEMIKDKGHDILYLTNYIDEFVIQVLNEYNGKSFKNIKDANLEIEDEKEKNLEEKINKDNKEILEKIKESLKDKVVDVKFTTTLKNHPVCLKSEGPISTEMEKVINATNDEKVNSKKVLVINSKHKIAEKMKDLMEKDPNMVDKYSQILYAQARLIDGLNIDNPNEISNMICEILSN